MAKKQLKSVIFNYIKNSNFKTYYANGVYGGIAPKGELQMDFFIERQTIPQVVIYDVEKNENKKANLGKEIKKEGKNGFVREFEVGVMMDMNAAIALHKWLTEKINEYLQINKSGSLEDFK